MTSHVNNNYLEQLALAMAGDSFNTAADMAVTDNSFTSSKSVSSFTELGDRFTASNTRSGFKTRTSALRVGVSDVVDTTNGDTLTGVAVFDVAGAGDILLTAELPDLLHTINFDIEFEFLVEFEQV